MKLWGAGTPRTLRPLWAMAELGLEYEHVKFSPRSATMDEAEFRSLSQRRKVPLLEDGDLVIGESAAIVYYLAQQYGGEVLPNALPGSKEWACAQEYSMYIMTEIDARLYTVRLHGEPPAGLSEIYGAAPAAVNAARDYVSRGFGEAERWIADSGEFALGAQFSSVDILLTTCLAWAVDYEIPLPPHLKAYFSQVSARPGFIRAMGENEPA